MRRDHVRRSGIHARESHAALPEETLAILQQRIEEVFANDGVARTHLGYDILVKLKLDELLLDRESLRLAVGNDQASLAGVATGPRAGEASVVDRSGTRGA